MKTVKAQKINIDFTEEEKKAMSVTFEIAEGLRDLLFETFGDVKVVFSGYNFSSNIFDEKLDTLCDLLMDLRMIKCIEVVEETE